MERLARWLSTPRGTVVRPLAGATLAIGLVLVAVGPAIRPPVAQQPDPPSAEAGAPAATATNDATLMMESGPASSPDGVGGMESTQLMAEPTPDPARMATSPAPSAAGDASLQVSKATPDPRVADVQALPGSTADPDSGRDAAIVTAPSPSSDDTSLALTLLGIVLAGTGVLVLLLTWLARRMTRQEPLS